MIFSSISLKLVHYASGGQCWTKIGKGRDAHGRASGDGGSFDWMAKPFGWAGRNVFMPGSVLARL
jgi:hypothetical protein